MICSPNTANPRLRPHRHSTPNKTSKLPRGEEGFQILNFTETYTFTYTVSQS
jgi:hypothetical protein